ARSRTTERSGGGGVRLGQQVTRNFTVRPAGRSRSRRRIGLDSRGRHEAHCRREGTGGAISCSRLGAVRRAGVSARKRSSWAASRALWSSRTLWKRLPATGLIRFMFSIQVHSSPKEARPSWSRSGPPGGPPATLPGESGLAQPILRKSETRVFQNLDGWAKDRPRAPARARRTPPEGRVRWP